MALYEVSDERAPAVASPQDRVLVVEDNALTAKVTRLMVEALGYGGVTVNDGADAAEACRRYSPVAILMDCEMPGMDGIEATRHIRALQRRGELPPCRIIMVTANDEARTRTAAFDAGVDAYVLKPLSLVDLQRLLQHGRARG